MNGFKTVLILCLAGLSLGLSAGASASNASVQVDQTNLEQDQTVTAVFTFKGKLNSEPDFSVLEKDFTIVNQGQSKSVEIVNGNYREQQSWTTVLLPKRIGRVDIPAVRFGADESNVVTLNVSPAKPSSGKDLGDLFLEAELTPESGGYVQQQHVFTVRIFFRGWLIDGKLSEPELNGQDVVVQSLGEPRRYSVTRNGERYQVYERRHALFPQASGELSIGETTFSGRLRLPVGGNRLKSVSTPALSRSVKPVPTGFTGDVWLPAESLELTEVWPSDRLVFEQGVPITRTISMAALGLTSAQLPALTLDGNDSVRLYPDQPRAGDQVGEMGVTGTRAVSVALVPQAAGDIVLPPIEVTWWDTRANRERVARLDARTLSVMPGAGAAPVAATQVAADETVASVSWKSNPWFFATVACALGWLLTWFYRPGQVSRGKSGIWSASGAGDAGSTSGLARRLKVACHRNDAKACAHLMGELMRDHGDGAGAGLWLDRAGNEALKLQWQALNRTLYGPSEGAQSWMAGRELWKAFEQAQVNASSNTADTHKETLAQLAPAS